MSMVIALKTKNGIAIGSDSYTRLAYRNGTVFDYHTGTKLFAFDNLTIGITGVSGMHIRKSPLLEHEIMEISDFATNMVPPCEGSVSKFIFEFMRAWSTHDCYVTTASRCLVCGIEHGKPCMAVLSLPKGENALVSCEYITGNYGGIGWTYITDSLDLDSIDNISKDAGINIIKQAITLTAAVHDKRSDKAICLPACIYFISNNSKKSGWIESNGYQVIPFPT